MREQIWDAKQLDGLTVEGVYWEPFSGTLLLALSDNKILWMRDVHLATEQVYQDALSNRRLREALLESGAATEESLRATLTEVIQKNLDALEKSERESLAYLRGKYEKEEQCSSSE